MRLVAMANVGLLFIVIFGSCDIHKNKTEALSDADKKVAQKEDASNNDKDDNDDGDDVFDAGTAGGSDTGSDTDYDSGADDDASFDDVPGKQDANPDTGADDDTGVAKDAGGGITSGVRITMQNIGTEAGYVPKLYGLNGDLGFTILDGNGNELNLSSMCQISCNDECWPINCEMIDEAVRQILPNDSISFEWDGRIYINSTCQSDEFGEIGCYNTDYAPAGKYTAHFCYSVLFDFPLYDAIPGDFPRRLPGDILSQASVKDPECVDIPFELSPTGVVTEINATFKPELGNKKKDWAYCGQAWTFSYYVHARIVSGGLDTKEGSSVIVPVTLEDGALQTQCWRYASMEGWANGQSKEINLTHGIFYGQYACEMESGGAYYYHVLPPQNPGEWTVNINTMIDWAPEPAKFEIAPCPECLQCPADPTSSLDRECSADCQCRYDAACRQGEFCEIYCLTNLDCPDGYRCYDNLSTAQPMALCHPQLEAECSYDSDCPKGFVCQDPSGHGMKRCLPDMDTRALGTGVGIHCGCDAECPGIQSCVKFETNLTDGICAIRCRDDRECPVGWNCVGMTQSGIQGICIVYIE